MRKGLLGKKKEGVDLGDGAIDSPAGPHFAPMEDKFLRDGGEVRHTYQSFLYKQKLTKVLQLVKPRECPVSPSRKCPENVVAGLGIAPIIPALRISAWDVDAPGLCGFFVARMMRSGGF